MLDIHIYCSFVILMAIIALTPGPNVILVLKYGVECHFKDAIFVIFGILLAFLMYGVIFAFGMSSIMNEAPNLFYCIRFIGSLYLIYLGLIGFVKLYKMRSQLFALHSAEKRKIYRKKLFLSGFLASATSPKTLINYSAIVPHFVNPAYKAFPQFVLLLSTHFLTVVMSLFTYCLLANRAKIFLKKYSIYQTIFANIILISLGVIVLFEKY